MAEGLRQREGDQPLPVGNDLPSMHQKAIDALESRRQLGIKRYGQPLQPANGRNAALDAWEESLDGSAYGAQVLFEQENPEHTYVGVLIQIVENFAMMENLGTIYFPRGMFVPDGVKRMLSERGIESGEDDL